MRRRRYLLGVAVAAGLAGCSGGGESGDEETTESDDGTATPPESTPTAEPELPSVSFSLDYDGQASELTVTHSSGETVRADRLVIRGDSIDTREWPAEDASGSENGNAVVQAGDSVTLTDVPGDYEVRVVWEAGDSSATLVRDEGPDA